MDLNAIGAKCLHHSEEIARLRILQSADRESINHLQQALWDGGGIVSRIEGRLRRIEFLLVALMAFAVGMGILTMSNLSTLASLATVVQK